MVTLPQPKTLDSSTSINHCKASKPMPNYSSCSPIWRKYHSETLELNLHPSTKINSWEYSLKAGWHDSTLSGIFVLWCLGAARRFFLGEWGSQFFYCCPIKLFWAGQKKIRAGTYCRSKPFLVTLLLPQTKTTMGKSNHFSGQPIVEPYHYASVNFCRTAIIPNRKRGRVKVKWHARVIIDVLWESVILWKAMAYLRI